MNKIIGIIITLLIFATVFVQFKQPVLHKQFMIVDSNCTFIDEAQKPEVVKTEVKKETAKPIVKKEEKQANIKHTTVTKKTETIKPKNLSSQTKAISNIKSQTKKEEPKINEAKKKQEVVSSEKNEIKPDVEQKIQQIDSNSSLKELGPPIVEVKELTPEEEIIAWNKWRSDLQNQVMMDTQISAPIGVAFKFSFTVDKFGNLSNVKVWSTTDVYSDMAVRVIKPVLMSYQGKKILNFPQGTKRIITNVAGGFVMSTTTGYSSPSDYSDYERVIR